MPKGVPKGMKLIRAPDELVSRLGEASNREGKAFFDYITELLEQAVRAHEMNSSLKEIVDFYRLMMMQKDAGLVITPSETLNKLIERLYPREKELLQTIWFESGVWYGKYLLVKVRDGDPVETFGEILKATSWSLKDVNFEKGVNAVSFKCVSFTLSLENTVLLMKFIEGVMSTLGYETVSQDYLRGMIDIEFKKAEEK